jgi:hypothetical protein
VDVDLWCAETLNVEGAELFSGQEETESNVGCENLLMNGGKEQESLGQNRKSDFISRILEMMEEERKDRERSRQ